MFCQNLITHVLLSSSVLRSGPHSFYGLTSCITVQRIFSVLTTANTNNHRDRPKAREVVCVCVCFHFLKNVAFFVVKIQFEGRLSRNKLRGDCK